MAKIIALVRDLVGNVMAKCAA